MKAQGIREAFTAAERLPLLARLRDGGTSPWHRVGLLVRQGRDERVQFDPGAVELAPAWVERGAPVPERAAIVDFAALVDGVLVSVGHAPVTGEVARASRLPGRRDGRLPDWRSGAPAPLRSSFPAPSRVAATGSARS